MTFDVCLSCRFILASGHKYLPAVANVLKAEFGSLGYRPTTMRAPKLLIGAMALCGNAVAKVMMMRS